MHKAPEEAFEVLFQYAKIVVYYLLLVGLVTTPGRLRGLIYLITGFILVITLLAILQYHEVIDLPALAPVVDHDTDEALRSTTEFTRLRGPGIFNDPNDLGQLLAVAMIVCLHGFGERALGILVWLWGIPLAVLGSASCSPGRAALSLLSWAARSCSSSPASAGGERCCWRC